jgi:hypothetical protein
MPLPNPRHESFAAFMAEGKTAGDAYELAGLRTCSKAYSCEGD